MNRAMVKRGVKIGVQVCWQMPLPANTPSFLWYCERSFRGWVRVQVWGRVRFIVRL